MYCEGESLFKSLEDKEKEIQHVVWDLIEMWLDQSFLLNGQVSKKIAALLGQGNLLALDDQGEFDLIPIVTSGILTCSS